MKSRIALLILLLLVSTALTADMTNAAESPPYITEYDVPTPRAGPLAIAVDRFDNVWFTQSNSSQLGVFFPRNGTFRTVDVAKTSVQMWGLTHDPNGRVWFTLHEPQTGAGYVGYYSPASAALRFFPLGTDSPFPMRIIYGGDGNIWFTEFNANKLGKLEPSSGKITLYTVPEPSSGPVGLAWDDSGRIWLSLALKERIASFNPANSTFTIFKADFPVFSPVGIAPDQSGNIWFADHGGNWIVRFNPTMSTFEKFPTSTPPAEVYEISIPNDLKLGPDGALWFTEHGGNKIGRLDPNALTLVEFHIPTGPIATVFWLDFDSNGNVWFTEFDGNKIGRLIPPRQLPFLVALDPKLLTISPGGSVVVNLDLRNDSPSRPTLQFQASQTEIGLHAAFSELAWSGAVQASLTLRLSADPDLRPTPRRVAVTATDGIVTIGTYLDVMIEPSSLTTLPIPLPILVGSIALASVGAFLIFTGMRRREKQIQP